MSASRLGALCDAGSGAAKRRCEVKQTIRLFITLVTHASVWLPRVRAIRLLFGDHRQQSPVPLSQSLGCGHWERRSRWICGHAVDQIIEALERAMEFAVAWSISPIQWLLIFAVDVVDVPEGYARRAADHRSYEAELSKSGFLAMGGQIIDASIVAAPKQHNSDGEKRDIKEGRIPEAWKNKPAKLAQKDRDARWTVKWSKAKPADDGSRRVDLAVPAFGYKNHIGIDRRHGLIRTWTATDAARHDGAQLPNLISKGNTGGEVWADTAYRSQANEKCLAGNRLVSRIHRKKPKGKPMPANIARANATKSKVRAAVEHVFARQKGSMGLFVRTIGIARATVKIGLANITYNMKRAVWLTEMAAVHLTSHRRRYAEPDIPTARPTKYRCQHHPKKQRPPDHSSKRGYWRCPDVFDCDCTFYEHPIHLRLMARLGELRMRISRPRRSDEFECRGLGSSRSHVAIGPRLE